MRGIKEPTDIFQNIPVLGRLRDLKLSLVLYRVEKESSCSSSSSEEESVCISDEVKSVSHTETEKSQDSCKTQKQLEQ